MATKMKKSLTLTALAVLTMSTFVGSSFADTASNSSQANSQASAQASKATNTTKSSTTPATASTFTGNFDLKFDPNANYTLKAVKVGPRVILVRAYENVVYVAHPQDTTYQSMNIYIPEAYFSGETVNGYTIDTAPIFFPNAIGGYMPATAMKVEGKTVDPSKKDELKRQGPRPQAPQMLQVQGANQDNVAPADGQQPPAPPADGQQPPAPPADGQQPPAPPADGQQPPAPPADGQQPPAPPADGQQPPAPKADGQQPPMPPADAQQPGKQGKDGKDGKAQGQRPEDGKGPRHPHGQMRGKAPGQGQAQGQQQDRNAALYAALEKGMIVVSPGARGRTLEAQDGSYYGKAPAAIVDLKAAVRYLHANDKAMPGDANKIIANGTSAGAALSTLLGATGNQADYEPYLKQLGAAQASDAIFAVSAYAPITNLDHADMAYEWLFNGVNDYKKISASQLDYNVQRTYTEGKLTAEQQKVSADLKAEFPAYLNSLGFKDENGNVLTLDSDGNGSFKQYVANKLKESAQQAYNARPQAVFAGDYPWLTLKGGKVTNVDLDKYAQWVKRMKTPPAFDGLALENGENNLFGNATTNNQHFTQYGLKHSTVTGTMADPQVIKMMNPMNYLDSSNKPGVAEYWRIRQGSIDTDTSLAVPAMLALQLENKGYDVNFQLAWNKPHSGDYDLPQLFAWIENITKPVELQKAPAKPEPRQQQKPAPKGDKGAPAQGTQAPAAQPTAPTAPAQAEPAQGN
ncbi:hypothetical protein CKF54_08035 [Psittacicella hinzii]|uniref:BD-FAE-like domain-containing protein n=1 Tax=Psittacicella hinzii TaxID=2028575 RepID=A0A3A1Y0B9_9GAMM|nr:subtype B tannase [Psittacicella hinzii]RIY31035.1 hypothetical protein CKF54_08035 [Psittacicella hinzii]